MELSTSLQKEKAKLSEFNKLDRKIQDRKKQIAIILDRLAQTFDKYKVIHEKYANVINRPESDPKANSSEINDEDLCFMVRTPFRRENFEETLQAKFNKTVLKSQRDIIDLDGFDEKSFTPEKVKRLIICVMDGTLKLLTSASEEETLRTILSDWYNTTYNVEMGGDTIGSMSPGKKALVLLKILIKLEDSKCPILIDQPEDDLDNRSIYKELTPFILSRKVDRQIIIVTHNANVVLGSDAEEIIVANQNGKNAPNDTYKFEYVTGSIEHCDKPSEGKLSARRTFSFGTNIVTFLDTERYLSKTEFPNSVEKTRIP